VVTSERLRRLGAGPGEVKSRLKVGRLHRKHRGVYAVGHPELSLEGTGLAAAAAIGADVVVSYHGNRLARARDAEKQAALELAGHRVMRVNEVQATSGREDTLKRIQRAVLQPASGS